jgi:choline-sulfatase
VFDGYDTGVRYADHHVGQILEVLRETGVADQTGVMISADHGENLGELGIYCDHQTADEHTTHLPLILRWPGLAPRQQPGLHYQVDVMATVLELFGAQVPERWDGRSFAAALSDGSPSGRDHLVLSHAAWTAQRSVRFDRWLCIRSYFDAYHGYPGVMLFDLVADPHEQHDQAEDHPEVIAHALSVMGEWGADALGRSARAIDPLWTVLHEGGTLARAGRHRVVPRAAADNRPVGVGRLLRRRTGAEHGGGRTGLPQSVHPERVALTVPTGHSGSRRTCAPNGR